MMKKRVTLGTVEVVDDEAKAGRIKVALAELGGDVYPEWVEPVSMPFWFWVPVVGQEVEVELPDSLDIVEFPEEVRYRGVPSSQTSPAPDEFKENYPLRRGFKTPNGMLFLVDDKKGSQQYVMRHANNMAITINKDGIYYGSDAADEPVVLGLQFVSLMEAILDMYIAHTHPTGTGPSGPPSNAATGTTIKGQITNKDHLSNFIFSQKAAP